MKTEYLYEFSVLAQTLSFSRAAQALFLSQSTLSKHIQRMEEELGAQLLVHSTHAVSLTEAGRLLARQADGIIRRCSRAQRQLRRGDRLDGGAAEHRLLDGDLLRVAHPHVPLRLSPAVSGD